MALQRVQNLQKHLVYVDTCPAVLVVLCDFQLHSSRWIAWWRVIAMTLMCLSHTSRHYCSSCLRPTMELGCCVTFVPAHCITCFWYYVTYHISIAALATL